MHRRSPDHTGLTRAIARALVVVAVALLPACGGDVYALSDLSERDVDADDVLESTADAGAPGGDGPVSSAGPCEAFPPAAVVVDVFAAPGQRVCDATVTVTDGAFSRVLQRGGPDDACMYFSVFERAGVYSVVVTHGEDAGATVEGVVVALDDCGHAITQALAVILADAPSPIDDTPIDDEPGDGPVTSDPDADPPVDDPVDEPVSAPVAACPVGEPAYVGDVVLDDDADLAVLAGVACLEGHLEIGGALETLALPDLVRVMGAVTTTDAALLAEVLLPALVEVGASLTVSSTALVDLDGLASLERVGGPLVIAHNASLARADMNVVEVERLFVDDNAALSRMRLRSLAVADAVHVALTPLLDDMDLRALVSTGGDVLFEGASLADLDLRALESVGGSLIISDAEALDSLDQLGALESVAADLTLARLPALADEDAQDFVDAVVVGGAVLVCGTDEGEACP